MKGVAGAEEAADLREVCFWYLKISNYSFQFNKCKWKNIKFVHLKGSKLGSIN